MKISSRFCSFICLIAEIVDVDEDGVGGSFLVKNNLDPRHTNLRKFDFLFKSFNRLMGSAILPLLVWINLLAILII